MSTDAADPSTSAPQDSGSIDEATGQTMLKLKVNKSIDTTSANKSPQPSTKRSQAEADPTNEQNDPQPPSKKQKKSTTIELKNKSPKKKKPPSRGKDKQPRISQAEILDDFFDMSGWLPPNSPGNASSMWRPIDRVREERVALGESVMRDVERERVERMEGREVEREREREEGMERDGTEQDEAQADKDQGEGQDWARRTQGEVEERAAKDEKIGIERSLD